MNVNLYVNNQSHAYIFLLQLPCTLSTACLWLCFGALTHHYFSWSLGEILLFIELKRSISHIPLEHGTSSLSSLPRKKNRVAIILLSISSEPFLRINGEHSSKRHLKKSPSPTDRGCCNLRGPSDVRPPWVSALAESKLSWQTVNQGSICDFSSTTTPFFEACYSCCCDKFLVLCHRIKSM